MFCILILIVFSSLFFQLRNPCVWSQPGTGNSGFTPNSTNNLSDPSILFLAVLELKFFIYHFFLPSLTYFPKSPTFRCFFISLSFASQHIILLKSVSYTIVKYFYFRIIKFTTSTWKAFSFKVFEIYVITTKTNI